MEPRKIPPHVREALGEVQAYLSDKLAPMMVSYAAETLMRQPAELTAELVTGWTAAQYQGRSASVPVSDYLFHVFKKFHLLAELKLIPEDRILGFLGGLLPLVIPQCPEEDRELLKGNVARLGQTAATLVAPVENIYRQVGDESTQTRRTRASEGQPPAAPGEPAAASSQAVASATEIAKGFRHFGVLVERLERNWPAGPAGPATGAADALTAQLLATAASVSQTGKELEENLARLKKLGIDVPTSDLFRKLGEGLPGWGVSLAPDQEDPMAESASQGTFVTAMRRMVTLAADPAESAKRFSEMVQAAVEQFNDGSLARAVTMFELAGRLTLKEKVDAATVARIRGRLHESLGADRLKSYVEDPENHPSLRKVLAFFPALSPEALLTALKEEEKREERRNLLSLLEVHGEAAREAALNRLAESLGGQAGETDWYFQRNLLYVLRRIPRPQDFSAESEVDFLFQLSEPWQPAPLVREAISNLGQIHDLKAEQVLVARLAQLESALLKGSSSPEDASERNQLLDRAAASLARQGTAAAFRTIADHALKGHPALGNASSRLGVLAAYDLSSSDDVVERLVRALRAALPVKVFGVVVRGDDDKAARLVTALSGTPAPPVRAAFEEIARKFPDRELGRAAGKALAAFEVQKKSVQSAPATMSGDLAVFGLPTLLQTFDQSQVTGVLVLRERDGQDLGRIALEKGCLKGCAGGGLEGTDAFFALLERPAPATFVFTRAASLRPEDANLAEGLKVLPLLFEGMRRYDELARATALIGDGARFRPTTAAPKPLPPEENAQLVEAVWAKAASGGTALECEEAFPADPFRARGLLFHWVEEGSLQLLGQ